MGAATQLGAEILNITLNSDKKLPDKALSSSLKEADIIVYNTIHKLHYTEAMRSSLKGGSRALMVVQPFHTI
jgi:hypothetical protein